MNISDESAHDKTYNNTCTTSEDSDPQSYQSLHVTHVPSTASGLSKAG